MPIPDDALLLCVEQFSARLDALNAPHRLAIAVSGGRDSIALMRFCAQWGQNTGASVHAFTVDHGLRPGSAEEAEQVAVWCRAADISHHTLHWQGEKPGAGIQAAARSARYRLLAAAAAQADCSVLMTAHSANDQAETLFMRLARGSGVRGLSAMNDETMIAAGAGAPVRLLRPLLTYSRAQLTAAVTGMGQEYIDDPSNDDPNYERVRVRALLAGLEENVFLTNAALAQTAQRLRAAERRLRRQEEELFTTFGGCFYQWGGASIDKIEERSGSAGLCARLIHAVSGEAYGPDDKAALSAVCAAQETGAATLAGALIRSWKGRLWFMREPGAVLGRSGVAPLAAQSLAGPILWDGRWILRPQTNDAGLSAAPVGKRVESTVMLQGPREAALTAPGIYRAGALIGAPALPSMPSGGVGAESLTKERFFGEIIRFS